MSETGGLTGANGGSAAREAEKAARAREMAGDLANMSPQGSLFSHSLFVRLSLISVQRCSDSQQYSTARELEAETNKARAERAAFLASLSPEERAAVLAAEAEAARLAAEEERTRLHALHGLSPLSPPLLPSPILLLGVVVFLLLLLLLPYPPLQTLSFLSISLSLPLFRFLSLTHTLSRAIMRARSGAAENECRQCERKGKREEEPCRPGRSLELGFRPLVWQARASRVIGL